MFKAKLVENENYYKLKRKHFLLFVIPAIPMAILANFFQIPLWLTLLAGSLYVLILFFSFKNQKRINLVFGNKLLEIDKNEIRIKSKKGVQEEVFTLNEVDKLIVKEHYAMPSETLQEVRKEIMGNTNQNYLIIQQNQKERKLYFEFDSYYMGKQLDKLIKNWVVSGYRIEKILN